MGKNKKLKILRKEARIQVREHLESQREDVNAAILAARRHALEDARRVLRARPRWLPRFAWERLKRIVLRVPIAEETA